jgi:hypothetical protein
VEGRTGGERRHFDGAKGRWFESTRAYQSSAINQHSHTRNRPGHPSARQAQGFQYRTNRRFSRAAAISLKSSLSARKLQPKSRNRGATHGSVTAREQVLAQVRESEATAKFEEQDSKRLAENERGKDSFRSETRDAASRSAKPSASVESLQGLPTRVNIEQQTRDSEREVRLWRIQEQISRLE